MTDQKYHLRAGQDGPEVQGTAGHVLTFQSDGTVQGQAPATSLPSAVRASFAISGQASAITFAPDQTSPRDIITEAGALTGLEVGMRLFVQPILALVGFFHSGTNAPELGGVYDVLDTDGDSSAVVQRSADMATAAQIAAIGIIAVDAGGGAGVYQVATPPAAVIDVDPQVMPQFAAQLGVTTAQVSAGAGGSVSWADGVPVPIPPGNAGTYTLQYDFGTNTMSWVANP